MVSIAVATVFITTSISVVSVAAQSVRESRDFYVSQNLAEELESYVDYIRETNRLRYGDGEFEKCAMANLDVSSTIPADCADAGFYVGKHVLELVDDAGSNSFDFVLLKKEAGDLLDDLEDPTVIVEDAAYAVYEKPVFSGAVSLMSNLGSSPSGGESKTIFHRYIDIGSKGNYRVVVAYLSNGLLRTVIRTSSNPIIDV